MGGTAAGSCQPRLLRSHQERTWKLTSPPHSHPHRGTRVPWREPQSPGHATSWQDAWFILHTLAPSWLCSQLSFLQEGHQALGLNGLHRGVGGGLMLSVGLRLSGCLHGADEESLTVRGNCKSVACVPSPSDHVFVSSTLCVALPWSMQLTLGLQPSPHRPVLII